MSTDTRQIIRYANRKLYDARERSYIDMGTLQRLVLSGEVFTVVDHKSKEDRTEYMLAYMIYKLAAAGFSFPVDETRALVLKHAVKPAPKPAVDEAAEGESATVGRGEVATDDVPSLPVDAVAASGEVDNDAREILLDADASSGDEDHAVA